LEKDVPVAIINCGSLIIKLKEYRNHRQSLLNLKHLQVLVY
jgi:DNA replication protein DnaC